MNVVTLLAHVTGQPHAHSHDLAATLVALALATAFVLLFRRAR
jgi:hypothetical protein